MRDLALLIRPSRTQREEFRTPEGVRKSSKNEPAGREVLLWGFVFPGKLADVDLVSHNNGSASWFSKSDPSIIAWPIRNIDFIEHRRPLTGLPLLGLLAGQGVGECHAPRNVQPGRGLLPNARRHGRNQ